jgi:hypothetical protein
VKHSVREAVARSHAGWDYAQADRVIAWLDHCGYAIVSKEAGQPATVPAVGGLEGPNTPKRD